VIDGSEVRVLDIHQTAPTASSGIVTGLRTASFPSSAPALDLVSPLFTAFGFELLSARGVFFDPAARLPARISSASSSFFLDFGRHGRRPPV
jgi:hypothetical protein